MHDPALPPRTRLRKVALVGGGVFLFFLAAFLIRALVSFGSPPFLDMVSGTEYISGEYGQVIARLTDRSDNPIADASCTVTVVYPDKSYFLLDAAMQQSAEPGNYYREFTTPTITEIYESIKSGYQGLSGEVQQQFNQTNTILTTQNQDLYADLRDLGAAYINIF